MHNEFPIIKEITFPDCLAVEVQIDDKHSFNHYFWDTETDESVVEHFKGERVGSCDNYEDNKKWNYKHGG